MANIELVTSHQGRPHITTDQVIDLLAGFSGNIEGIKILPLDGGPGFQYEVESGTEVTIGVGQGLARGYFFQLLEPYVWQLDPGAVGYCRIDALYLVIYEDPMTQVQSSDFVYVVGTSFPDGETGEEPPAPSGTNIKETFKFFDVMMSSGAIEQIYQHAEVYITNSILERYVEECEEAVNGFNETIAEMQRDIEDLQGTVQQLSDPEYERITYPFEPISGGDRMQFSWQIEASSFSTIRVLSFNVWTPDPASVRIISSDYNYPTSNSVEFEVGVESYDGARQMIYGDVVYIQY